MYKILILEDNGHDVELVLNELHEAKVSFKSRHVTAKTEFLRAVHEFSPDVILADYSLPMFNGMEAFRIIKERQLKIPYILVSGVLSEEFALECVKEGIDDFILKSSFKRLPSAIMKAIDKKKMEREKEQMDFLLHKSHRELQLLIGQLHVKREEERQSIARDLHDELGQQLTALKIDVNMLGKKITSKKLSQKLVDNEFSSIEESVDNLIQSIKRITRGLRLEVLDQLGVEGAIRSLCQEFQDRNGINCEVSIETGLIDFDQNFSVALFRIVQETLTNVARHAAATSVELRMEVDEDNLWLKISDNGKGICKQDLESSHSLGIIGIRERARFLNGKLLIKGESGVGTTLLVEIPLKQKENA